MTLKEKVFSVYRRAYKTEKKPTVLKLAQLVNICMDAAQCCPDAEKELGSDVLALFRECSEMKKGGRSVHITDLLNRIGATDDDFDIR